MENLEHIKRMIDQGDTTNAILLLDNLISKSEQTCDDFYYLRGNAYRKQGDWQKALNNYLEAKAINPESSVLSGFIILHFLKQTAALSKTFLSRKTLPR